MKNSIVEVAVNVPVPRPFHYSVPETLKERLARGHRVLVPFGRRMTTGVCVGFPDSTTIDELKPIRDVLHPECRFDDHLLELTRWVAEYYRASWGEVLESALPPSIRRGKKHRATRTVVPARPSDELEEEASRVERRSPARARVLRRLAESTEGCERRELLSAARASSEVLRRVISDGWASETSTEDRPDPYQHDAPIGERFEPTLHPAQERAVEAILDAVRGERYETVLVHGITGSGKTEVYLRALREVIAAGGRGLVLLPEIALTPQTVRRFREGLRGGVVAVLHSMLSPAERTGQWRDIQEGRAQLVIGARSAAFAPVPDLRLIVVDEEHESSYKQESSPRYNARDVAVVRATLLGIPVVLGSATPSLESIHNARSGKYRLVELPRRATAHDLPSVTIVPLDGRFYASDGAGLVSDQLDAQIRRTLRQKEQTLIFLNRRGFATYLHCTRCGFVLKCHQCDVTMTFHRRDEVARCHYCGYVAAVPDHCPDCQMPGPRKSGVGTEKVVSCLERRYPDARIARLDRDTITTHEALKETLARFARGDFDILVGTQMIAKGHDFPGVSLVGILLADVGLHMPDFRAAERTFQLVTQVAGRAGRGDRPGRVIVQTFSPEHFAIRSAAEGNYRAFADKELKVRGAFGYPPFGRLVKILISGTEQDRVNEEAARIKQALVESAPEGVKILGPAASPIARIQSRFRIQILLKAALAGRIRETLTNAERALTSRRGVDVAIDVDPQSLL